MVAESGRGEADDEAMRSSNNYRRRRLQDKNSRGRCVRNWKQGWYKKEATPGVSESSKAVKYRKSAARATRLQRVKGWNIK